MLPRTATAADKTTPRIAVVRLPICIDRISPTFEPEHHADKDREQQQGRRDVGLDFPGHAGGDTPNRAAARSQRTKTAALN